MRLDQWLEQHGITQAAFAKRVKIDTGFMCRLINGGRRPGLMLAARIEDETGGAVEMRTWVERSRGGAADAPVA